MPIDRNHLPGTGDFQPPDDPPGLPEWAITEAEEDIMTDERCFEFVSRYHYEDFKITYHKLIEERARYLVSKR